MELYLGGTGQGKLQYVLQRCEPSTVSVADGADCTMEDLLQAAVINHFHLYIRRLLLQGDDVQAMVQQLLLGNGPVRIIMDEIGCGIVPMDAFERQYREQTGRVSCVLAQQASHVERITCGIGRVLK